MSHKQLPCCARLASQLNANKGDLNALARKAAYHASKGRNVEKYKALIATAKATIKSNRAAIDDHDAQHAAEGEAA